MKIHHICLVCMKIFLTQIYTQNKDIKIKYYVLDRRDRLAKKGDGILVYLNNNSNYERLFDIEPEKNRNY